jgi:hypothetical protein
MDKQSTLGIVLERIEFKDLLIRVIRAIRGSILSSTSQRLQDTRRGHFDAL